MNDNELAKNAVGPKDRSAPHEVEVVVVGAGPVGLTGASVLAASGIRTAVFDRALRGLHGLPGAFRHSGIREET